MPSLPYTFWCYHLTTVGELKWRRADWASRAVVKGLKKDSFGGSCSVTIRGVTKTYDKSNIQDLVDFLMPAFGQRFTQDMKGPIDIVPIPNSNMAVGAKGPFRIVELATAFAKGFGKDAAVVPAIRWAKVRTQAHKKKEYRHPDLFEPDMRLVIEPARPVVLFDDVLTSGSQMIAAARLLLKNGVTPARGFVVARAVKEQYDDAFLKKHQDTLDIGDDPFDVDF